MFYFRVLYQIYTLFEPDKASAHMLKRREVVLLILYASVWQFCDHYGVFNLVKRDYIWI